MRIQCGIEEHKKWFRQEFPLHFIRQVHLELVCLLQLLIEQRQLKNKQTGGCQDICLVFEKKDKNCSRIFEFGNTAVFLSTKGKTPQCLCLIDMHSE